MKKAKMTMLTALIISVFIIGAFPLYISSAVADSGWTLTSDARPLKAYPNLQESIWQKNATAPPHTAFDKIGLHRLIKTGITPRAVVLLLSGATSNGEGLASNPNIDNFTKYETYGQAIYWANRGLDVFTVDFRKHFLPNNLPTNATQLAFMRDWGWDTWISDIKEVVEKVKEVSGTSRIFLAGMSDMGLGAMNYATKYWQQDLRGIILLDGAPNQTRYLNPTSSYNLSKAISDASLTGKWYNEGLTLSQRAGSQAALSNPAAPAPSIAGIPSISPLTGKPWANITELFTFVFHYFPNYPVGGVSNLLGGYGNITQILCNFANADRFTPTRMNLETESMYDWVNSSDVTYDFTEHYKEIDVPLIGFFSGKHSNSTGNLQVARNIANSDYTVYVLSDYGHYDIFYGAFSTRDVSEPSYQWMLSHYQPLTASATPVTASAIIGQSATFSASPSGGVAPYTYQWYTGPDKLMGQTSAMLTTSETSAFTYTFYCKVTDSEGATANSNSITLAVTSVTTSTTATTQATQAPSPSLSPILSPSSSTSPSTSPSATSLTSPSSTSTNPKVVQLPETTLAIAAAVIVVIVLVIAAIVLVLRKQTK